MNETFYEQIEALEHSDKPIELAWDFAIQHLSFDKEFCHPFLSELNQYANELDNNNPYHNHVHLAQVMLCCAYLLNAEFEEMDVKKLHFFPLLLAAMFHDANHPGRPNNFVFELEYESVKATSRFIESHSLDKCWNLQSKIHKENWSWPKWSEVSAIIKELILSTEFKAQVSKVSAAYTDKRDYIWSNEFPIQINRLKMLLIESDILLSCLPKTGWKQSIKMLVEAGHTCENAKTVAGWKGFLELTEHHYQSDAANHLGIRMQINQLKDDLKKIARDENLLSNPMGYLMNTSKKWSSHLDVLK